MKVKLSIICFIISIVNIPVKGYGQMSIADSCGLDSNSFLNKYEILFVDSFLFRPYLTKKAGRIDPKNGFDFTDKKVAFYSCTVNTNTKGKGFISKQKFFGLLKPTANGHAGIGLIKFTGNENNTSGGFDAVIIINCPYNYIDRKELILKLLDYNR